MRMSSQLPGSSFHLMLSLPQFLLLILQLDTLLLLMLKPTSGLHEGLLQLRNTGSFLGLVLAERYIRLQF